ncbi:MAG: stage II sporulation protein M [Candidatus Lokiarchaeota archaeon]|nr:stage II sporulation protein M [Candidatus Lokiarchaeota archaeon]
MRAKEKITRIKKSLQQNIRKIFVHDLYVEGQQPSKSYFGERKFFGLYFIFLSYSFLILIGINFPGTYLNILTFGNPFAFGNALVAFFLALSILYSNDKIRVFIFGKNTLIKQVVLYISIIAGFYLFFLFINNISINFISYLLGLSTIWLILLSTRFFMYSRKFATKIEARLITKYSALRRFIAFIAPYFILGVLVVIALFYRGLLVYISLDVLGPTAPSEAVGVYVLEMRLIMPLIYFSLILTLLFIIFEFVFTRRRAETKRAGLFDNYTFSLIVLFIFFFQVFQLSLFLILNPATVTALRATVGASNSTVWSIFIIEFVFSMYFLYRIIKKLGRSLEWRFLIFKRDGLILLILGCVLAQTLTRFALQSQLPNQEVTLLGQFFMADKYIVSIIMIIFLGSTLLFYYLKPHETSMFIRLQKETINQEEESMEIIYKLIRSEYLRRGEGYPLEILERELIRATRLSKNNIYSLVEDLANIDMNISLTEERDQDGRLQKIIDFSSVLEKFDKKAIAQKKAKKYLSDRLFTTMTSKKPKKLDLNVSSDNDKASDQFISSLATDYTKKQKDELSFEQKQKDLSVSFTQKETPNSLKNAILEIVKKEYTYRIENQEKYPDFNYSISEIASEIQMETRITPGQLYPILENISERDIELDLIKNPNEPEDRRINFFPIADDDLNYAIAHFRPEVYKKIKIKVIKNFIKFLKRKKAKAVFSKLRKDIGEKTEEQKVWNNVFKILNNYYPIYVEEVEKVKLGTGLLKIIKIFPKKDIDIYL